MGNYNFEELVKVIGELCEFSKPHKLSEEQKLELEKERKDFKKENDMKIKTEETRYELTMDQRILLLKCMGYEVEGMNNYELKEISSNITIDDLAERWNELL